MSPTCRVKSHRFKVIPALCHKKQKNKNFVERDSQMILLTENGITNLAMVSFSLNVKKYNTCSLWDFHIGIGIKLGTKHIMCQKNSKLYVEKGKLC